MTVGNMKKTLLWVDDYRDPNTSDWLNFSPIGKDVDVVWVKSYDEFTNYIMQPNPLPDGISFDHDLADMNDTQEKTGYDCLKFLIDLCINLKLKLPICSCHSSNPVGRERIESLINSYKKLYG